MDQEFEVNPGFDGDAPIGGPEQGLDPELQAIADAEGGGGPGQDTPFDFSKIPRDALMKFEMEYAAAGKQIKEPIEMILKRAQQGYDYAQKMGEWNRERDGWAKEREGFKELAEIDKYARENPEWHQFIQDQWKNRQGFQPGAENLDPAVQKIMETVKGLQDKVSTFEQDRVKSIQDQEDKKLDQEVKTIREQYKDIDFDLPDEFGKSLELRVIEHGQKNGISNFKAAFRDFYFDTLVNRTADKAKEGVVKQNQHLKKNGFIGETSTPTKGLTAVQNVRNRSYDDLRNEALKELGIN